jgi:O-methyltransferase
MLRSVLSKVKPLRDAKRRVGVGVIKRSAMRYPTFDAGAHGSLLLDHDYFRFATLGLAVERVLVDDVRGALAEVGVYQGAMSQFVHNLAPERTYYLFDTFEGFPSEHLEGRVDERFRDTSVEGVRACLGNSSHLVLRAGMVPETFAGLDDERFAFVLLDLDLHEPTMRSLEFFYPRLSPGGYLIVHDYNNPESNWGCKRAADEFLVGKPEHLVEIADVWGTALLRKT